MGEEGRGDEGLGWEALGVTKWFPPRTHSQSTSFQPGKPRQTSSKIVQDSGRQFV
jgi:hypothetical protein